MNLLHTFKIIQHSDDEIAVFLRVARLNFNLEVKFPEDRNVLPEKYLAFTVITTCSFVFTTLVYFVTFL